MEIEIKISDIKSLCHIKLIDDDNAVFEKEVRLDDLIATFRSETTEEHYYPVPKILRQTLLKEKPNIEGLVIGIRNSSLVKGLFFIPAGIRYLNFAGEQFSLPYPSILMYLVAYAGSLHSSYCYTVKEQTLEGLTDETQIYAFPFGNVCPKTGKICWGNNSMTSLWEFRDLHNAVIRFFSSESNSDYVHPGESYVAGRSKSYPDLLRKLSTLKKFPNRILIPSRAVKTVGAILEQIEVERRD